MNKKFFLQLLIVIFIGGVCGAIIGNYINSRQTYRPFEFRGGFRYSGGNFTRSTSHVLVNEDNYNLEELYIDIYNEFVLMNGVPDELTLYLYDTIEDLHANAHFSEKTYTKSPD